MGNCPNCGLFVVTCKWVCIRPLHLQTYPLFYHIHFSWLILSSGLCVSRLNYREGEWIDMVLVWAIFKLVISYFFVAFSQIRTCAHRMEESAPETGWKRPGPKKRSAVWDHFRVHDDFPTQTRCAYCNAKFSVNTSTGVLGLHTRKSCSDAPESAKVSVLSATASQSTNGKNRVSRKSEAGYLSEVKGATEEEAALGRLVALVGLPIYKLSISTDIQKGEKLMTF